MSENRPEGAPADEFNPYAPPTSDLRPEPPAHGRGGEGYEPFSASLVIGRTWEIYSQRMLPVMAIVLGAVGVNWLYQYVGAEMEKTVDLDSTMGQIGQYMFLGAGFVLQAWLSIGQSIGLLKIVRGERADLGDIFQGGPYFLRYLGATLIYVLLLMLLVGVCLLPAALAYLALGADGAVAIIALGTVGGFAAMVQGLILVTRLYHHLFLIIDRDLGPIEALKQSYEITRGNVLELCGLTLTGVAIALSGLLLCGIGILFTLPLSMLMFTCLYEALAVGLPRDFYVKLPDTSDSDYGF